MKTCLAHERRRPDRSENEKTAPPFVWAVPVELVAIELAPPVDAKSGIRPIRDRKSPPPASAGVGIENEEIQGIALTRPYLKPPSGRTIRA